MSDIDREISRRTRRSFLVGGAAAVAGAGAWAWMRTRGDEDGIPGPFRRVLGANEKIARAYFSEDHLSPKFDLAESGMPRVNGTEGLDDDIDLDAWKLQLAPMSGAERTLTMADVRTLPRVEMTTELKCIEGWSKVVHWAGARFRDFAEKYQVSGPYVSMVTPDEDYYVGLEQESALHPQTLLCYEMQGQPLTPGHGAPLRLVTPVKYGIKNIKCIGKIQFQDKRPDDYWAERGYDWYAGL